MHIALPIGKDLLMASDIVPSFGQKLNVGNNNYVSIFRIQEKKQIDYSRGFLKAET
jgi:hypothetical protein